MKTNEIKICKEHEFKYFEEYYPNGCPYCMYTKISEEMSWGRAK
mgnify:CR=1 FL=1